MRAVGRLPAGTRRPSIALIVAMALGGALAAFARTLARPDDGCTDNVKAPTWSLFLLIVGSSCALAVLVGSRRWSVSRVLLVPLLLTSGAMGTWYIVENLDRFPMLATARFMEDYENDHVVSNASLFIPEYLPRFDGVDAADVECVMHEAGLDAPGARVVSATVGELRSANARCGLGRLTTTYCVEYPNT
jgi:hypothetical protein